MRPLLVAAGVAAALSVALPARAVEGGATDRVTTHAIAIATGGPQSPAFLCSGTLIAPNVVLTARHCIARFPAGGAGCSGAFPDPAGAPTDLWVTAAPWTQPSSDWKNVISWVVPRNAEICGNDVALLILGEAFTEATATPARPVLEEPELRRSIASRIIGVAGFGALSANGDGAGTRRSRFDVPLVCVPGDLSYACGGELDSIAFNELTTGSGPCIGDSGAGAMASADHGVVFGVLARGAATGGQCAAGVFERTDVWGWLIAKTVLEAAAERSVAPAWASAAFPEHPVVGDRCRSNECGPTADCITFDSRRSFVCAKRCSAGCDEGFHCESNVCVAGAAPDLGGGCALGSSRGDAGAPASCVAVAPLCFLLVALARKLRGRRDRARACCAAPPRGPRAVGSRRSR